MLFLYHGSTSVCAIKVRVTLAEKGLDWAGELLDLMRGDQHRPEYATLNPAAVTRWMSDADRDRFDVPRAATAAKVREILWNAA